MPTLAEVGLRLGGARRADVIAAVHRAGVAVRNGRITEEDVRRVAERLRCP